jgi:hypothetical protein
MLEKISFDCRFTERADALEVTYTIKNDSDEDLGVFNHLQGIATDGGLDFSPNSVFVDIEGDLLRLLKMALPIPPGLRITAYIPPHASLLPAGEVLTEVFTVPIPVKVRQPFKRAMIKGEVVPIKLTSAKRAEVTIGVFPAAGTRLVAEHPAFPEVRTAAPPDPAVRGQVTLSAGFTFSREVPVLDYVGFPWP